MRRAKILICKINGCENTPHRAGLCKDHLDEHEFTSRRRKTAIDTLHHRLVEGQPVRNPFLREEINHLYIWWDKACTAVNYRRSVDNLPYDEAEYAVEWCISIAQEIIEEERSFRLGGQHDPNMAALRQCTWDRFINLEIGLQSNGLPR